MSTEAKGKGKAKPAMFTDDEAARLVLNIATTRQDPLPVDRERLDPEWGEAALLAAESGEAGIDSWIRSVRPRSPEDAARYRQAIDAAKAEPVIIPMPGHEEGAKPAREPYRLNVLGAKQFARTEYRMNWLVRNLVVEGQPGVIAAPKKGMKTTTTVDLAVSAAMGDSFLGHFAVPEAMPVLFLSGESGGFVIQDTVRRVCEAKGIEDYGDALDGRFFVGFELPQLSDEEQLAELVRVIEENKIRLAIIDPLYLCLIGAAAGKRIDPANLFDMGPLFLNIAKACLKAGATPLLIHHFKQTGVTVGEMPELENMAYAGIQEFARQWILLSRRERFEPGSGLHKLWLCVGGSAGHSGEWAIDIDEGVMADDFTGRRWGVQVKRASEVMAEGKEKAQAMAMGKQAERANARDMAAGARLQKDADAAYTKIQAVGKATTNDLRDKLNWAGTRAKAAVVHLADAGRIRPVEMTIKSGAGTRQVDGWEINPNPPEKEDPSRDY